jgi:hypothetical protein
MIEILLNLPLFMRAVLLIWSLIGAVCVVYALLYIRELRGRARRLARLHDRRQASGASHGDDWSADDIGLALLDRRERPQQVAERRWTH